jgi:transposase
VKDKDLYQRILGIEKPWEVVDVDLQLARGEVHVHVALPSKTRWVCPDCHERAPVHDHRERTWRHLDTCQYRTVLHARVPRLSCPTHGIRQLQVPWAEPGSRFTALFEALAIDWLKHAPIRAVATRLGMSWDEAAGIMQRAVRRGLTRRKEEVIPLLGVDEISFQKRHEYVTVVSDLTRERVLFVADNRRRVSLDAFWTTLTPEQLDGVAAVAMDMWEPFIQSTRANLPDADSKIVLDKFHLAQNLGKAVDQVRRAENRKLRSEGKPWLTGTRYDWLRNPKSFSLKHWRRFLRSMRKRQLKTARAWLLKEEFMALLDYKYVGVADRHFRKWYGRARRSRLEPMQKLANTFKRSWANIRTYFTHRITNSGAESINSLIKRVKTNARGFRNRDRFRMAIMFHCGGLDLYPQLTTRS